MSYTGFKAGPLMSNPSMWEVSATNKTSGAKMFWIVPVKLSYIINHHNRSVSLNSALGKQILATIDTARDDMAKRWGR